MRNLHHPNWTGKAYRSKDEAFGGQYIAPQKDKGNHPIYWVISVVLILFLAFLGFMPLDSKAQTINYVERSLNKTIIVKSGRTTTIPSTSGGIRVVTPKNGNRSFSSPKVHSRESVQLCRRGNKRYGAYEKECFSSSSRRP